MLRQRCLILMLVVLAANPSWLRGQANLAPFYSLPADGTWVEYDWKQSLPDKREKKGLLRISAVGSVEFQKQRCRWIEIKIETRQGDKTPWQRRKLLLAEKAFREGLPLEACVLACYHQENTDERRVDRISNARLSSFLGMGIPVQPGAVEEIAAREEVPTSLGKILSRHVSSGAAGGERARLYHGWLTDGVPFGVAKFEIQEKRGQEPARIVFTATLVRKGQGAKSELDESTVK